MGVHYIAADTVEECWQLLRQTLRSVSYECLAHLPTYSAWLKGQDWTGPFRTAPAEPAADRAERRRQAVGAEEPESPVLAGRDHRGLPGRADHPDAPGAAHSHRIHVLTRRACHRRLVEHVPRCRSSARTSLSCGRADWRSSRAAQGAATTRRSSSTSTTPTSPPIPIGTVESVYAHFGLPYTRRGRGRDPGAARRGGRRRRAARAPLLAGGLRPDRRAGRRAVRRERARLAG